ncbi:DNA-3-methyladenine glycosylase family protein [Deinococcus ruber]|uniref:DNA-3-methyladenine glycosylase II n=1 Tax=Deinococcus ruber TaxID=1848197 RepID=A0A918CAS4_9DEIO|nr:DNA-3-methyladenine glycosylase 2 family protein [Deinococcus ruber]GGR12026.1 DNA-3-methyladenine glycosidase [Deinococcus ruber]
MTPSALFAAQQHLSRDPVMADIIARAGDLPELLPASDPFAALVRAVLGQQLSVKAAAAIAGRVEAATDFDPARLLALSPDDLRALGLSWAKVRTVRAISGAALGLEDAPTHIDFVHLAGLPDEAVIEALLPLPGIGRWTAEMFLMFSLARPDVFSFGDYVLRLSLAHHYPGQDHAALVQRWSPWRTLAARYLWHARP